MYIPIILLSLTFLLKSVIFTKFFNMFLLGGLFQLELASLSNTHNDTLNTYSRWALTGWLGLDDEEIYLQKIQTYENNDYIIIISWVSSIVLYHLYYFIRMRKHICKQSYFTYLAKYALINYTSLYLWNLNTIINYNELYQNTFWFLLINVLIFNAISFWFTGLMFNLIYGDKLHIYRKKYDFLINDNTSKYKYFIIVLIFFKILTFMFSIFYNYYRPLTIYSLLVVNLLYIIFIKNDLFIRYKRYKLLVLSIISISIIMLSIIEQYIYHISLPIIKIILMFVYIIILFIFNHIKVRQLQLPHHPNSGYDVYVTESNL